MRRAIIGISVVMGFFILACSVGSSVTVFDESAIPPEIQFQTGEYRLADQVWPNFLPADIPPIPAAIDTIIADEQTMRIFFHDFPEDVFLNYLNTYESEGYSIQYLLYASEDEVENGQTKAFDAVDLVKENNQIRIAYENNAGTMDIDIAQLGIKVKHGPDWPTGLQGIKPVAVCDIETLYMQTDGTINLMCLTQNGDFLSEYAEQLIQTGFRIAYQFTGEENEVYQIELKQGKMRVEIRAYNENKAGITVINY